MRSREEIEREVRDEMEADIKSAVEDELKETDYSECIPGFQDTIDELDEELGEKVRAELEPEVMEETAKRLREKIENSVIDDLDEGLEEEIERDVWSEYNTKLQDKIAWAHAELTPSTYDQAVEIHKEEIEKSDAEVEKYVRLNWEADILEETAKQIREELEEEDEEE